MKKLFVAVKFIVVLEVLNKVLLNLSKWLTGYPGKHLWTTDLDNWTYIGIYLVSVFACFLVPVLYRFIFGKQEIVKKEDE